MTEGIPITVEGHQARITSLHPRYRRLTYRGEESDFVCVVEFDGGSVEGTLSVGLEIPAKEYERDELIALVVKEAETYLDSERERKRKAKQESEERQEFSGLAERVARRLGIEPMKRR